VDGGGGGVGGRGLGLFGEEGGRGEGVGVAPSTSPRAAFPSSSEEKVECDKKAASLNRA